MSVVLQILATIAASLAITFTFYWVSDAAINDWCRFRDWVRNRPTLRDPDRWNRFERERLK